MVSRFSCESIRPRNSAFLLGQVVQAAEFKASSFSDIGNIKREVLASHFLMRTTFGPRQADIDALALRIKQIGQRAAFEEWLDDQFDDFPLNTDWQAYEPDRGRHWPLAKKCFRTWVMKKPILGGIKAHQILVSTESINGKNMLGGIA